MKSDYHYGKVALHILHFVSYGGRGVYDSELAVPDILKYYWPT